MTVAEAVPLTAPRLSEAYKKKRWLGLGSMSLAGISDNMEGGLVNTLFPVIQAALGLELGALGVISSISKYSRMLFGMLWSMAADRWGRKRILVFVTGVWGIWTAAAGLAQNYTQLLILYAIGAIATVASEPIMNGLLVDMFEDDERGAAYGAVRTIAGLGSIFFTPLIGRLADINDGWRIGMYIMGAISVVSGILIAIFVEEPPKSAASEQDPELGKFRFKDLGTILKIPTVWFLAIQLLFITSLLLFAFMVTYLVQVRGWTTAQAAVIQSAYFLGFGISGFIGGKLGDWFVGKFGEKGRVMMMQLYLVGFAIMTYLFLQIDWGQGPMIYVIAFLAGLEGSLGFSGCVLPMVGNVVEPKYGATTFALLFSFIQGAITATTLLFIGKLVQWLGGLPQVMLYLVSGAYAINAVFWFVFYRFYPKDVENRKARMAGQAA